MSDFENFLDSLDIEESSAPAARNLSDDDFNDVLNEIGFEEAPEEEEEEWEEDEEVYDENQGENHEEIIATLPNGEEITIESESSSAVTTIPLSISNEGGVHTSITNVTSPITSIEAEATEEEVQSEESSEAPLIQPNSPTLLLDESTSRFSGTEWYNEIRKQKIILAGLGGIGSWLALQLARMSPETLLLYDDDAVEAVNMSGQLYGRDDVGTSKADAISKAIHNYTTAQNVYALQQRFTPETEAGDVMICGFDNMAARKVFFDAWVKHVEDKPAEEWSKCLFIDGRLSIDTLQVLCIRGDDVHNIKRYRDSFLFSDEEAEHTVCSMKQTTYLACMIGSVIVNLFTNFVANSLDPIIPYDLPFFTEYDSQNMIFKVEH